MINVLPTLFIILLGWLLSGAVHELGHVIVGKMAGLNVVCIQLIPPAVQFSGKAPPKWQTILSIAGPLLPVLVGVMGVFSIILLEERYPFIRYMVWIFLPMMMHSLIFLCVPIAAAFGIKASNGDITKFIELAKWHPLAVSLIGLLLVGCCGIVFNMAI